jgi:phosphohistidine phosphatase
MKKLFLMRHAKSSWRDTDIPDHERPLKKKGIKDAERMGKLLKSKDLVPDLIISSTAVRSQKTAEAIAESSHYKHDIIYTDQLYMAEPSDILKAITSHADKHKAVMVIGHNPGLEAFLQILTGKVESLPTSSIAYLTINTKDWKKITDKDNAKIKKLWRPKDL